MRSSVLAMLLPILACGSSGRAGFETGGDGGTTTTADPAAETRDAGGKAPKRDAGTEEDDGGEPAFNAPEERGPFDVDDVTGTLEGVDMHAFFPRGADERFPVIVFGHAFQVPPSQYDETLEHLATHGYIALTADFAASLGGSDNDEQARQLALGLDWVSDEPTLGAIADLDRAGTSGHSLGGKIAIIAAKRDDRVKASIVLDPVDGNGITASELLPDLRIPTAFLGETLDATANLGGQACAPKNANYSTFYARALSPSLEVTIDGASHMSFLDDVGTCGLPCSLCKKSTIPAGEVATVARGFLVAFFERHLKDRKAFDTHLATESERIRIRSK